jgi:hypothetical protein
MADPRRGVYLPVLPLDVLILKELPKVGTTFMGVYPEAASIADLRKKIAEGKLPSSLIGTRLRVLHQFGMAEAVTVPRSPTAGWQVTPEGEQFIIDQDGVSNGSPAES